MTRGEKGFCGRDVFKDRRTDREVWRMTGWSGNQAGPYMHARAFSGDERYLVFVASAGDGWTLHRLEIETGETLQLSETNDCGWATFTFHPGGEEVYYVGAGGRTIYAVDPETAERRTVARITDEGWTGVGIGGPLTFSADGALVATAYRRPDGGGGVAVAETGGGSLRDVFGRGGRVSHVQFRPGGEPYLTFVAMPENADQDKADLPDDRRARAWGLDPGTGAAEPFLVVPPGFRATHEHWDHRGGRLYYHQKTVPGWVPNWIKSIPGEGGEERTHYGSEKRMLGHSATSPDGTRLVTDVQDPAGNELILVDLETGDSEVLCWPDSSVDEAKGQLGHVHPSFSPSGSRILYTSDVTGRARVYVVPLGP